MSQGDQLLIGWQGGGQSGWQGGWISEVAGASQDATIAPFLGQLPSLTLLVCAIIVRIPKRGTGVLTTVPEIICVATSPQRKRQV